MTLADFQQDPWSKSHQKYKESTLSISPAPEYASSEILVASLYRTIGFLPRISEGSVPQAGRNIDKTIQKHIDKRLSAPAGAIIGVDSWNTVVHGVLESPKLKNQSSKRFLQVTPLVPATAIFSGSARLVGNPWTPGVLVRRMVWLGSRDHDSAKSLWGELFQALSIDADDDIFARWLEQETSAWNGTTHNWVPTPVPENEVATLSSEDFQNVSFIPARQFVKDLHAIIQAKGSMTRRQWISLLEAVLRLATVAHVTWLCDVQARIWSCLSEAIANCEGPTSEAAARLQIFPDTPQYMTYGGRALQGLKDKASGYLSARLGTNALLWSLDHAGIGYDGDLSSSREIARLCAHIRDNRDRLLAIGTMETISNVREKEARALLCKKGIGKNLSEFSRHVLGQRETAITLLKGYDQGYILRKKGNSLVISLGPVAVLAFVHCALAGMGGPRSIHRLGQHFAAYGLIVDRHDIIRNDLGHQLRMLGLVLDSPDAESGMLLLPPFPRGHVARANDK